MTRELYAMLYASKAAEEKIMEIYRAGFEVEIKEDDSPVTLADKTADRIIREILQRDFPDYGFLTEESTDDRSRLKKESIFVVDPVDGTKDFVKKNGQFTTNIAWVFKNEVIAGVVNLPSTGETYFALKNGGAYYVSPDGKTERIHVNGKTDRLTMLVSNFHTTEEETAILKITATASKNRTLRFGDQGVPHRTRTRGSLLPPERPYQRMGYRGQSDHRSGSRGNFRSTRSDADPLQPRRCL